jgi:5'-nucleotidase
VIARALALVVAVASLAAAATGAAPAQPATVTVEVIALNDVHGTIAPVGAYGVPDPSDPQKTLRMPTGGVAYLASAIARLRARNPRNIVVGAGDLVGASPLDSALFHDEPVIEALNRMGLAISSLGNHEFDEGKEELLRKQRGGCRPGGTIGADTCLGGRFDGASFRYLAANVLDAATGATLFPPYAIESFDAGGGRRVRIAFVGAVTKTTPRITTELGTRGVRFTDEAAAINAQLPAIGAAGVHAVIVLVHEGLQTRVGFNDPSCSGAVGDLLPILDALDPAIPIVISGHTHQAYVCPDGHGSARSHALYTQASSFGRMVTAIDVTLDVASGRIARSAAHNELVVNDAAPNPLPSSYPAERPNAAVAALVERYERAAAPLANRVVGKIGADLTRAGNDTLTGASGESSLGDAIADARVAASADGPSPVVLGFVNAGGIRSDLFFRPPGPSRTPGDITYGDVFAVEPFGNVMVSVTLTGTQLYDLLEQQFTGKARPAIMGSSRGLRYSWDATAPEGHHVVAGSVTLDARPIDPAGRYRVAVDSFMADGGDGFVALKDGTDRQSGRLDRDVLAEYLNANMPLAIPPRDRILRVH